MNLFQFGEFKLNSGAVSKWKLECDALTDEDIEALAYMISQIVQPFGSVLGVPRGGLRLEETMKKYITNGPLLMVDDVLTTGGSMERMAKAGNYNWLMTGRDDLKPVIGAVIFARGKCPSWIKPLFQMPEELWIKGGLYAES